MNDIIIYNGIKFYKTAQGYYLGNVDGKAMRLHRYVWILTNGEIPKGYHIHHIDHDMSNNDISNLELLPAHTHHSEHMKEPERIAQSKRNMEKCVRPKAIEWHKSKSGRNWHKQHWDNSLGNKLDKTVEKICEICGKTYMVSPLVSYKSRFCSNKCKSAYRRKSGKDDIPAVCAVCKKEFKTNKYSPASTCSQACENLFRKM